MAGALVEAGYAVVSGGTDTAEFREIGQLIGSVA